ncbi:MAG: MBOAT family protein [Paludibacteraceae bacterium]|nr:MBOAT family protein [Paludibacteraceae bacterium]
MELLRHIFAFDAGSPLLFTQFYFWAFFAIVFAFFAMMQNKILLRNTFLFAVSLFFYYKTSGIFVGLLIFSVIANWLLAIWIHATRKELGRKLLVVASAIIDLGILCYFKYAYFFTDLTNSLFGTHYSIVEQIVLPVGISFFTFQTLSYTVDVYRRRIEPVRNLLNFGFYVSFFPQLVAGPIVRATDFVPQLYKPYSLTRRYFGIAVFWILNGLAKKIILSDYLAVNFVDRVFNSPLLFSGFENTMALLVYSMQVYADFSGYTDIAIGVAMLMGFYLPRNFNSPYKAPNCSNFWKRWHISLSKWLQDYLYIPLGGNRNATFGTFFWIILIAMTGVLLSGSWVIAGIVFGIAAAILLWGLFAPSRRNKIITNLNLMVTMLLGGLWHGASFNFIIWGGLNGVGIVAYKIWRGWNIWVRLTVITLITAGIYALIIFAPAPLWNLLLVWTAVVTAGTLVKSLLVSCKANPEWLDNAWGVTQTFFFISFTRLFFRSSSNLDPALANQEAWQTASNMVNQIGTAWNIGTIPDICLGYWKVFVVFLIGMIIHWIPEHTKRRYRYTFAVMPLWLMAICASVVIFFIYQFVTAELQPFIYFQF